MCSGHVFWQFSISPQDFWSLHLGPHGRAHTELLATIVEMTSPAAPLSSFLDARSGVRRRKTNTANPIVICPMSCVVERSGGLLHYD